MAIQHDTAVGGPRRKPFQRGSGYLTVLSALALVLVTVLTAVSSPLGRQVAFAGGGGDGDNEVIFTKWITAYPNMQGVVSGVVGGGLFAGEILEKEPTPPTITKVKALYHINGGTHQFTALVNVTQDNTTGMATIHGVVTDGWQANARVEGGYQVIGPCSTVINAEFNVCFQGTLHLLQGSQQ
jgi:hypothetical protein